MRTQVLAGAHGLAAQGRSLTRVGKVWSLRTCLSRVGDGARAEVPGLSLVRGPARVYRASDLAVQDRR